MPCDTNKPTQKFANNIIQFELYNENCFITFAQKNTAMNSIKINSIEDLPKAAKEFKNAIGNHTVIAFHGEMGAGKTTFIKALCSEFGVTDNVSSPTFAIINEYLTPSKSTIYHFDLYRLETIADLQNIGAEDYFYSGNICLVEWPELAEPLFPGNVLNVTISVLPDKTREIIF